MDEIVKVTNYLEYLFLKKIINGLTSGEIKESQARELAANFLKMEPFNSLEEVKDKLFTFTNQYPYFKELFNYVKAYYEEKKMSAVIEKMKKYMKENEIDKALKLITKK